MRVAKIIGFSHSKSVYVESIKIIRLAHRKRDEGVYKNYTKKK